MAKKAAASTVKTITADLCKRELVPSLPSYMSFLHFTGDRNDRFGLLFLLRHGLPSIRYFRTVDIPPSTPSTCPVIQPLCWVNKKWLIAAMSSTVPVRLKGYLAPIAAFFSSLEKNRSVKKKRRVRKSGRDTIDSNLWRKLGGQRSSQAFNRAFGCSNGGVHRHPLPYRNRAEQ